MRQNLERESKEVITVIKDGGDLTKTELSVINESRKVEFGSKTLIKPEKDNEDERNKYFLIKDSQENILAFGVLRDTKIEFRKKVYPTLEFVSVISIKKGQGYGSLLMEKLKKYAETESKTLIGFCESKTVPFYLKSGFETTMGSVDRFVLKKDKWSFQGETPGEAVYVGGKDGLIEEMSKFLQEEAYVSRHK